MTATSSDEHHSSISDPNVSAGNESITTLEQCSSTAPAPAEAMGTTSKKRKMRRERRQASWSVLDLQTVRTHCSKLPKSLSSS